MRTSQDALASTIKLKINMTKRITSVEALDEIIRTGKLSKRYAQVLRTLAHGEPKNQTEVYHEIKRQEEPKIEKYSISPRFAPLERMGLIETDQVRPCRFTGRNTVTWKLTGRTRPVMTLKQANDELKEIRSGNRLTLQAAREEIEALKRRVLKLEQLAGSFTTGQMEMV